MLQKVHKGIVKPSHIHPFNHMQQKKAAIIQELLEGCMLLIP